MNIILLIGSPGSGKSTLGAYLAKEHSARCRFFSAGKWIRKNGLLHSKDLRAAAKGQLDAILKDRDDTRLLRLQARRWPCGRRAHATGAQRAAPGERRPRDEADVVQKRVASRGCNKAGTDNARSKARIAEPLRPHPPWGWSR